MMRSQILDTLANSNVVNTYLNQSTIEEGILTVEQGRDSRWMLSW